ncbi:hypothetical protein ACLOJK_005600 [Asimina triloba]
MVDQHPILCCMCGDVGFSEKLFRCTKCQYRFQHSYCSNYYESSSSEAAIRFCDWCESEQRGGVVRQTTGGNSKRSAGKDHGLLRAGYSGGKIKHGDGEESSDRAKSAGSSGSTTHSPRPAGRRYKLLKDVLC